MQTLLLPTRQSGVENRDKAYFYFNLRSGVLFCFVFFFYYRLPTGKEA